MTGNSVVDEVDAHRRIFGQPLRAPSKAVLDLTRRAYLHLLMYGRVVVKAGRIVPYDRDREYFK